MKLWNQSDRQSLANEEVQLLNESLLWLSTEIKSDTHHVAYRIDDIDVGNGQALHAVTFFNTTTFSNEDHCEKSKPIPVDNAGHLVCAPGYSCGIGHYARSAAMFAHLNPHRPVTVIDWLGHGLSSFPEDLKVDRKNPQEAVERISGSLEGLCDALGVEKLDLCGHSLGGYLSFHFASNYPHRIRRLVLASCIGMPVKPANFQMRFTGLLGNVIKGGKWLVEEMEMTPMSFLRAAGPLGPSLSNWIESKRYGMAQRQALIKAKREEHARRRAAAGDHSGDARQEETDDATLEGALQVLNFGPYVYHYNAQSPCGEPIVMAVLDTEAFARDPIGPKFAEVFSKLPDGAVSFLHGASDWVSPETPHRFCTSEEGRKLRARVEIVDDCGHQMFVMNPKGFAHSLTKVLRD